LANANADEGWSQAADGGQYGCISLINFSTPIFGIIMIGFGHCFYFYGYVFKLRMHFKKKIAKNLLQVFFAVVNGGRGVDARRIFIQFLIPMSWAKTNILWLCFFSLLVGFWEMTPLIGL
jgi:hypothetical protein